MRPFELAEPSTLAEAASLLDPSNPGVRAGGGCTALMLMLKAGVLELERLVSLRRIESRHFEIAVEGDVLRLGSQVTLSRLQQDPSVRSSLPVLHRALARLANVRVRNVATVGGSLAHADPHMDLPAVLTLLDAQVLVQGTAAKRTVAVSDLITGYMETTLAPNELIAEVRIPTRHARHAAYRKVTTRAADDWPALGIAVALDLDAEAVVQGARIVVSAAADRPTRLSAAETLLSGVRIDDTVLRRAADTADTLELIGDQHGSAAYKRELLRVHLSRALREAAGMHPMSGANR